MLLQRERELLQSRRMLKTDIARELYSKYYYLLFEFAKDLGNSNVQEISIKDNSVVITTRREGILLNCPEGEMTSALGQLILAGTESDEQEIMTYLLKHLVDSKRSENSEAVFFDIGANFGWYSIFFKRLFPSLQVHAFEPIKFTFEQLIKNLSLNQTTTIQANNFGLADKNGTVEFFVSPSLLAASSLADTYQTSDKIKIEAEIKTLDHYCHEHHVIPTFIKCDVEGAELLVFKGALKTLSSGHPVVMTELLRKWAKCFNYHPNDVLNLYKELGYSCFVIANGKLRPFQTVTDETIETNYFFLHSQTHKNLIDLITA